jgi:citrate synthase
MKSETWPTAITRIEPNKLLLRGYPIDELMGATSFPQTMFLAITGEMPNAKQAKLIDAILVSSIDHGVMPPSCQAVRNATLTGAPLNGALASGLLAINQHHGGAIENCMNMLKGAVAQAEESGLDLAAQAEATVSGYRAQKRRLPGYGHRLHTKDPRATKLFTLADAQGVSGSHVQIARAMQAAVAKSLGRDLPINVDGAIAAVLCDLGVDAQMGNLFFMLARLPGLAAHALEERTRMRPMRHMVIKEHEYDGPDQRPLENLQSDGE